MPDFNHVIPLNEAFNAPDIRAGLSSYYGFDSATAQATYNDYINSVIRLRNTMRHEFIAVRGAEDALEAIAIYDMPVDDTTLIDAKEFLRKEITKLINQKNAWKNSIEDKTSYACRVSDYLYSITKADTMINNYRIVVENIDALLSKSISHIDLYCNKYVVSVLNRSISNSLLLKTANNENTPVEIKYQYIGMALQKGHKELSSELRATRDRLESVPVGVGSPAEFCALRLRLLNNNIKISKAQLTLPMLYPSLRQELREAFSFAKNTPIRKNSLSFVLSNMQKAWTLFNDIKSNLMLLGYSEERVTRFLSWYIFGNTTLTVTSDGIKGYDVNSYYSKCNITNQFIPTKFLVPLITKHGERITANIYYLSMCNQNLGRNYSAKKYDIDNLTGSWLECNIEPYMYYTSTMCNHSRSALDYLSPRALPNQNIAAYNTDKGFSPTPFMGVELEVERNQSCIEDITEHVADRLGRDFVVFKYDGSLRGHDPFEIVTVPATLEYHKERWKSFMDDVKLKSNLISYASGRCGIHVHISRNSFTGLHLAKFMRFINMVENRKFIATLAQRGHTNYSRFTDKSIMDSAKSLNYNQYGHYDAVNTSNKRTVEVRIFRGNLAKTQFYKNLEFVHALWSYTLTCSIKELKYTDFLLWLFDNKKDHHKLYANLEKWLIAAGYNVSNVQIKRTCTPEEKLKLIEERKRRKKLQLVISKRFKPKRVEQGHLEEDLLASA